MRDRFQPKYARDIDAPAPLDDRPRVPGRILPPNPGEDREGLSPFGRLAKGCALGKSSILRYDASVSGVQDAGVDMLTVEGDDLDATQMIITLATPRVIPLAFADLQIDTQNITGELDNLEIGSEIFPGTAGPVSWPPLEALVEFGVKGARAKAVVDYIQGMTFSVVASYLRVHALVTQSEANGGFVGSSAAYFLAAFVGPGYARGDVRRTVYVGVVNNNAPSGIFAVPKFASRATVVSCDTTVPPNVTSAFLSFFQDADGVNNVGNYFQSGNSAPPFDVPASAAYFSVYNDGMGVNTRFAVIFELALS